MPRGIARDHDEKRAGLRKGSAAYFARHGYDRASMTGAARECGVSKALIYHYYDSKEALLFDILDTHLSDLVAVVEAAKGDGLPGLIRAILSAYEDADAEHKLQLDALATLPPGMQAPLVAHQRRLVAIMAQAVAADRPGLPPDRLRADAGAIGHEIIKPDLRAIAAHLGQIGRLREGTARLVERGPPVARQQPPEPAIAEAIRQIAPRDLAPIALARGRKDGVRPDRQPAVELAREVHAQKRPRGIGDGIDQPAHEVGGLVADAEIFAAKGDDAEIDLGTEGARHPVGLKPGADDRAAGLEA